ncbi:hypothetical protein L3Y34_008824 [Caenorhabditis briggsae]|uniref:7TM GPCR serpentine receptor class x (Srx) domain-containing protein n=2 Tax=Caenorhabditis briggsae TaxID=6238 RepID=A0AAE9A8I7_CAEBR|nr:hypothetical protein L3Y34_008824 [Caenorhabditis briggsae]
MSEDLIVGGILFCISLLGVVSNWTVLLFLPKSIHKSFGTLTRNQAFGDALQTTTVFFVVVPMVLFDIQIIKTNSNLVSFVMLFGYEVSVLSHLLLSFNRLCAVSSPLKYHQLYSIYTARQLYRQAHSGNVTKQINKKEVGLLVQTCLQGMLFSIELVCYFVVSPRVQNKWSQFFLTTVAFSTIHACDGAISIMCNAEFRELLFRKPVVTSSLALSYCPISATMEDSVIVGIILLYVSMFGVLTNWTVLLCLPRIASFNKSFGYITWNQAFGDALQSTTVFILVVPMVFFDLEFMKTNSNYISLSMLLGYDISVLSHLLLALNRLCVVASPTKFQLYNEKLTFSMIIAVNIYASASIVIFFLSGCKYSWSSEMWMFLYHVSNQCVTFSFYAIFCKYICIIFIIVLIDVFVICKARLMYKKSRTDASSRPMNSKEICFLVQTCLQGVLFSIELICYFIISPTVEDTWVRFFMTTFAFSTIHACDGAISIACNSDFRSYLYKKSIRKIRAGAEASTIYGSRVETTTMGFRSRSTSRYSANFQH